MAVPRPRLPLAYAFERGTPGEAVADVHPDDRLSGRRSPCGCGFVDVERFTVGL